MSDAHKSFENLGVALAAKQAARGGDLKPQDAIRVDRAQLDAIKKRLKESGTVFDDEISFLQRLSGDRSTAAAPIIKEHSYASEARKLLQLCRKRKSGEEFSKEDMGFLRGDK